MIVKDVFRLFQPVNDDTATIDYIITWITLYEYHHEAYYHPAIRFSSDCEPKQILSDKVLNSRVIEMSAEDKDTVLIRIEEIT